MSIASSGASSLHPQSSPIHILCVLWNPSLLLGAFRVFPDEERWILEVRKDSFNADPCGRQMGQLFMMGFDGTSVNPQIRSLIEDYHLGSVLLSAKNLKCMNAPKLPIKCTGADEL